MPPKTRTTKAGKASKENTCVFNTKRVRKSDKVIKPPRRALADKTNSTSDDNASILITDKQPESAKVTSIKRSQTKTELNSERPRRERRLPKRFKENNILSNVSTNDISQSNQGPSELSKTSPIRKAPNKVKKVPVVVLSPLKTPVRVLDSSLIKNRPKRICRLPSKFDDHSISPNKFIPVQPINASTPLANKSKQVSKVSVKKTTSVKNTPSPLNLTNETQKQKTLKDFFNKKPTADTNNNAKNTKQNKQKTQLSPKRSPILSKTIQTSQNTGRNNSLRVLGDNKKSLKRDSSKLDIYEFTYDPQEEPPPAKKKKKKAVAKKPTKPKITIKSNYDKNLAKALATLKSNVSSKACTVTSVEQLSSTKPFNHNYQTVITNTEPQTNGGPEESIVNERNYNSVRVEDIAMDMQPEDDYNLDYSPVNSPAQETPAETINKNQSVNVPNVNDPLNLQDDISFFDEQPAASSSMNVSIRHPLASPWRVEFGNLPIKWQVNTYVKPNMTPAVESSFINFNDSKKKYVYTDMVAEANQSLPEIVPSTPNLKQTSIMSFIKEVVEKSANKKRKCKSTPVKANSLFEDVTNTSIATPNQKKQPVVNALELPKSNSLTPNKEVSLAKSNNSSSTSNETGSSNVQDNDENAATPKDKKKKSDKNLTYFGFNESEDQENISPKKKNKARSLRSRTRGILQELNTQKGPMRAIIPVAAKSKPIQSSDAVNKMFDTMKSATEPPVFPEVAVDNVESTNVVEPVLPDNLENEDSESVHLFEDIEFIHHQKANRKSYGKSKKVAFNKSSTMDNNSDPLSDVDQASSDENLDDLSFRLPSMKPKKVIKKKKTNKQKLSKKEEKEVEAWAAGFNSMCEDIDEFDLVVE
ncbi:putative uncharacterized protein DDB_G0277255 [Vanessa cardui]|uniref:putative uncharacterized protein DDB_G0277255 n=1 Tax=Vanessa cardui TaxID=171605 RepID=UPI001F135479|nr:putative uncharacterized protein DDB_G0277255 [Vanessa cardui]